MAISLPGMRLARLTRGGLFDKVSHIKAFADCIRVQAHQVKRVRRKNEKKKSTLH